MMLYGHNKNGLTKKMIGGGSQDQRINRNSVAAVIEI